MINAVFLLSLCFIIFIESIKKFIDKEVVEEPWNVLIVGIIGLVMNLFGLCLFHGDGTAHGHSHGVGADHGHSHEGENVNMKAVWLHVLGDAFGSIVVVLSAGAMIYIMGQENQIEPHQWGKAGECGVWAVSKLNESGVFDKSTVANATSLLLPQKSSYDWIVYIDPTASLILVIIILLTTLRVLRLPIIILLQTVPNHIDLKLLQFNLIQLAKEEYKVTY